MQQPPVIKPGIVIIGVNPLTHMVIGIIGLPFYLYLTKIKKSV